VGNRSRLTSGRIWCVAIARDGGNEVNIPHEGKICYIPHEREIVKGMTTKACGAKTRQDTPCKKPAMLNGRCRLHGGLTPIKHGRRSKIKAITIREWLEACGYSFHPLSETNLE
jgi:hypothetical protein